MQRTASNAADECNALPSGLSQPPPQTTANRSTTLQFAGRRPESVSRSEAGFSADLSAASNMAAQGEEPMSMALHGGVTLFHPPRSESTGPRPGDAEKWFQDSNKHASTRGNVSFTDDDPPFHLPQRSNESTSRLLPVRTTSGRTQFHPPHLKPMNSIQSSSSGEFRSVIDDLTVENKKLKKRLKMYERSHASHLHPDRMFEVRMPGLAGKDKQRLERLLKEFADSVSGSDMSGQYASAARKSSKRGSSSNKPSSSSSTTLHSNNHVDSAYASVSTSAGNTSGSQSHQDSRTHSYEASRRQAPRQDRPGSKDQRVRSYLQNISQGLLPRKPTAMTEIARKRQVVRRLEQLFTGRASTNSKNSQSAQQQEVSTAAANDDQRASEARGRPVEAEGSREAQILPAEDEAAMLRPDAGNTRGEEEPSPNPGPGQTTIDQRPTRPLDLDLNRAQNAADNLAYIRHLGFKPNTVASENRADEDGWIYLNLLIGMAQLHTVNVTIDFVRQAVKDESDKFELSADGTRIRWKGGTEGTRMSGNSGSSSNSKSGSPPDAAKINSPRSRSSKPMSERTIGGQKSSIGDVSGAKTSSRDVSTGIDRIMSTPASGGKRPIFLGHIGRENTFQYEPMFLHGADSDDENDYFLGEDDSLLSSGLREDTTGSGGSSNRIRKAPTQLGQDSGPLIFYHRARFVTDLSGDQGFQSVNNTNYLLATQHALGSEPAIDASLEESQGILSTRSPQILSALTYFPEVDIPLPEFKDGVAPKEETSLEPHPLPVCGLGGITPAENIVFYPKHKQSVRKRKQPMSDELSRYRKCARHVRTRLLDSRQDLLERIPAHDGLEVRLDGAGSVKYVELETSELPPPNYAHASSSSADDTSWDSDGEMDADDQSTGEPSGEGLPDFAPPKLMRTFEETAGSGSESSDEDIDEEDEEEEEFDLLAHERALNAEEVAEREREWEEGNKSPSSDAHSSLATVGDRSFLSDEGGSLEERSDKRRSLHAGSKRSRTEIEGTAQIQGSPAKRVETPRTKNGKK